MSGEKQSKYDMESIYRRLDTIEDLLKISIANDIIGDLDVALPVQHGKAELLHEDNAAELNKKDIFEGIHYEFSGKKILHLECKGNHTIQNIDDIRRDIVEKMDGIVPVFCFDKLNGMKRKRMLEKKISFCVTDKEIHIMTK